MAECKHGDPVNPLGPAEWNPGSGGLCSRYTGHELRNGRMVISLVVTSSMSVPYGHAHVVFEWRDNLDYVKAERQDEYRRVTGGSYRKHKVFHLLPKENFGGMGVFSLIAAGIGGKTEPGVIRRGKAVPETPAHKQRGPHAAHYESGFFDAQRKKGMTVSFLSWCVDHGGGRPAFEFAKSQFRAEGGVPFQLVGSGPGDNCLSWSRKVLGKAGIEVDAKTPSGAVASGVAFMTEEQLKEMLRGGEEGLLAFWARGVPH